MKRILIYTGLLIAITALAVLGWRYTHYNLSFSCSSSLTIFEDNISNNTALNMSQRITFYRNGKGIVNASGDLHHNNKTYVINRTATMSYSKIGGAEYSIHVTSVAKTGRDDMPPEVEKLYISALSAGSHRIVSFHSMPGDDLLLSFSSGPYLVCARLH
ncbi:hypothetical protein [Entomohabitans teleogrylli]|uniref:hypothetical protein n=1 Tax=Entomohabitans teleogrylli TaxID=1384589 RepID=UPI00073D36A9|nr:hypothetical protein [Entomohabitans teleogrylli]